MGMSVKVLSEKTRNYYFLITISRVSSRKSSTLKESPPFAFAVFNVKYFWG